LKRGREKLTEFMSDKFAYKMNNNYSSERNEYSKKNEELMKVGI
jgi:hypothetical protein